MAYNHSTTLDSLCSLRPDKVIHSNDFSQIVIKSRQNFDSLFNNAVEIYGVTYADSPELIYDFFMNKNLQHLELVVGDAADYREKLQGKLKLAEKLEELKSDSKLLLYVSNKMIHAKFYFVKTKDNMLNVIVTSANLTKNAQDASYQKNIADIYTNVQLEKYKWLRDIFEDNLAELKSYTTLFMDDLTDAFNKNPEQDKRDVLKDWLNTDKQSADEQQTSIISQEIMKKALLTTGDDVEFIMDVKSLPKRFRNEATMLLSNDASVVKKQEQRFSIDIC
ncbi:MAG: phospholipase D family protein [Candidatus Thermoplasmatota archaeon]|nr:phospholipase D family protein [Candidatus Thermoplasmatota archaeon]